MNNFSTVCFTGHRPARLNGYDLAWICSTLYEVVEHAYESGVRHFISGGALGVDQWAADVVLQLKAARPAGQVTLTFARPFPAQHSRWAESLRERYAALLGQADRVVDVSPDPYAAWKMHKRNRWMVDNADAVIAVWDGGRGGTAGCMSYARQARRAVLRLDPAEQSLRWL